MSPLIFEELVKTSGLSEVELLQELVLLLFQREKLSLGKASRILGMTQLEFQAFLASRDLYIHYNVEDLHEDVNNLQELGLLGSLSATPLRSPISSSSATIAYFLSFSAPSSFQTRFTKN